MKKKLFINNTNSSFLDKKDESLEKELTLLLKQINKTISDFDQIYIVGAQLIRNKKRKIIKGFKNVKILYSNNFTYVLKQIVGNKTISKESFIFSNSLWELYLSQYMNLYKKNITLKPVLVEDILKKYNLQKENIHFLNDFIFLQEKNTEFSIGEKKTKELFIKYKDINGILENIHNIENDRVLKIIQFQKERIEYYLIIQNLFLKEENFYDKK